MIGILFEKNTIAMLKSVGGKHSIHLRQQITYGLAFGVFGLIVGRNFFADGELGLTAILVALLGVLVGEKYVYIQLINEVKKRKRVRREMFPDFVKYFNSTLPTNNNNIVNTLEMTAEYLDEPLQSETYKLVERLRSSEGRKAYEDFGKFIGTAEASYIMGLLSDFDTHGVDSDKLRDMEVLVDKMVDNIMDEKIIRKANSIEKYANPALLLVIAYVMFFVGVLFIEILGQLNL